MVDSKMLQILAFTSFLMLVVVATGWMLEYGFPANFSQLSHLLAQPSPTPQVALNTTSTTSGSVERAFPPVILSDSTVSIFSPVLQPAVPAPNNGLSIAGLSQNAGTAFSSAFESVSDFATVQGTTNNSTSSSSAYSGKAYATNN